MAANCYGFALGIDLNVYPGFKGGDDSIVSEAFTYSKKPMSEWVKPLLDACRSDGLKDTESPGDRAIAVFLNKYEDCLDYHFYWYSKPIWWHKPNADTPPKSVSDDPKDCNKRLVGTLDSRGDKIVDQLFCGFLYAPHTFEHDL